MPKKLSFARALAIQQTGAQRLAPNRYRLNGAVFTGKQLAIGRAQFATTVYGIPKSKARSMVGLKL